MGKSEYAPLKMCVSRRGGGSCFYVDIYTFMKDSHSYAGKGQN